MNEKKYINEKSILCGGKLWQGGSFANFVIFDHFREKLTRKKNVSPNLRKLIPREMVIREVKLKKKKKI